MKKLLSLLTISTLATSVPAPLLVNTTLEKTKSNVGITNSNNEYVPLREIKYIKNKIESVVVDNKENIYFSNYIDNFVLKQGETTVIKINGIEDDARTILIDNSNNVYFGTNKGLYKLLDGETTANKINKLSWVRSLAVDKNNSIYVGTSDGIYKLDAGSDTPNRIDDNGNYGDISSIAVDKQDNVYFGASSGAFVLKQGATKPKIINNINRWIIKIFVDNNNNVLIFTNDGIYKLDAGSDTPTKIKENIGKFISVVVDNKENIYYVIRDGVITEAFFLKHGKTIPEKITGIIEQINSLVVDSKDNIYIGTSKGLYILQTSLLWTKEQSQFNLVDSSKTKTWTSPDLLSVDGELNIEINNNNIDKVLFDNILQPQTAKQWNINVKPETSEKDHNLQVIFTLDGKQYTSKIIVSMQAKIDPPTPSKQENLSDVIKFGSDNNLGNILDNNGSTIESKIQQINSRIIDFSQIEIVKKDMHSATLTAKKDSKSYQGSVVVKYNVVPATVVDLKIDLKPTSPSTQVDIDYVGQIDTSNITNPVNNFYYANSESKITMKKPTNSSVITGVLYGCDNKWNKTEQSKAIDQINGIVLDGSQLSTTNGKYVVELSDNLGHSNNIYLQIAPKQEIANYFATDNGKQFEIWAKANGHDNIHGYSVRQLNKLFEESKKWQQLASDSQFANAVAEWFKTNGKLASKQVISKEQIIEQLKHQTPNTITIDKFVTNNYDLNKVSFEIKGIQFQPNEKIEIVIKYGSEKSNNFELQIENNNPPNNNKKILTGWAIGGIIVGVLSGLLLLGWLLKKFVITPFILEPIRKKKAKAFAEKTEKDIAQMKADEAEEETKRKGKK